MRRLTPLALVILLGCPKDAPEGTALTTLSLISVWQNRAHEGLRDPLHPQRTFSPNQKNAPEIHCVYYELLTDKGWVAPRGSKAVCY